METTTLARDIFENMKAKFFALLSEKKELEALASKMFDLEKDLVFVNPELEKTIEAERGKLYQKIAFLKVEIEHQRINFTAEELKAMSKEYYNKGAK